jgi:hypothetical protein
VISEEYLDAGIAHRKMQLSLVTPPQTWAQFRGES